MWDVLADVGAWPQWWPGVESVQELAAGDERRVGSRFAVRWRSSLPYRVEFDFVVDEIEEPTLMSGRALGDLEGTGTWRLFAEGVATTVTYDWDVRTTQRWMNALAPLARPAFRWSHNRVMAAGGEALALKVGAGIPRGG